LPGWRLGLFAAWTGTIAIALATAEDAGNAERALAPRFARVASAQHRFLRGLRGLRGLGT
jgi:hypothetical protein